MPLEVAVLVVGCVPLATPVAPLAIFVVPVGSPASFALVVPVVPPVGSPLAVPVAPPVLLPVGRRNALIASSVYVFSL